MRLYPALLALCLLAAPWPAVSAVTAPVQKEKDLKPIDIVIGCVEAFFRNDDPAIRQFLTDKAKNTLSDLATTDNGAYNDIRRALLGNHPLARLADAGVKVETITAAGGSRELLLKDGNRIVGNVSFRDSTEENLAVVEIRFFLNSDSAHPTVAQVVLNRDRKLKVWRITAFYVVAFGGQSDDVFELERLTDARVVANETAVIPVLRQLQEAEARYSLGAGQSRFGSLAELKRAGEVTGEVATGAFKGYKIEIVANNEAVPPTFMIHVVPQAYGKTGRRSFVMDDTAKLHGADRRGERATLADPVIVQNGETGEDN
jgi:hypothetical protein